MSDRKKVQVTRSEAEDEVERLGNIFPVVLLMDAHKIAEEESCLLNGEGCPCMRKVACDVLAHGGEQTRTLRMGNDRHRATARYLEVDGEPHILLYATLLEPVDESADAALLYTDPLTGVHNRRFYEEKVRKQHIFAGVAIIDLDDFKLVNDTLGHHVGDLAVRAAAQAMKSCVRESDILLRYGGDEFVMVLPNIGSDDFTHKLETVSKTVANLSVPGYEHMTLSVSIGGVLSRGSSVAEAVKQADALMYRAKQRRNSVVTDADNIDDVPEYRKPLLLIVDDSEMNREILKEMLHDDYEVLEAADGAQGIAYLEELGADISLVLLDIVMPGVNGFEVLARMVRSGWIEDVPVIMISSEDSDEAVLRAYELGASDYIGRPFDIRVVRQRVSNVMRLYAKQRRLSRLLAQQFYERERDSNILVNIMGGAMELRNGESGPHVLHVRNLTEILLERLVQKSDRYTLTCAERTTIAMTSTMHDIGKIAIADDILNKPGPLTPEEFEIMKTHTTLGSDMLDKLDMYFDNPALLKTARDICRWHHERWDGDGYPDGLKGDEIPISAQVVSVADVYDALTSERVYKHAVEPDEAIKMIMDGQCGSFNPLLLDCLLDVQDRIKLELGEPTLTPPRFHTEGNE